MVQIPLLQQVQAFQIVDTEHKQDDARNDRQRNGVLPFQLHWMLVLTGSALI